jgi:hypothetical protein
VSLSRTSSFFLLNAIVAVAAVAVLLIHFIWRDESWANYAQLGLFVVGVFSVMLLYRRGQPDFFPIDRSLTPKWRTIGVGTLILLACYPWALIVGLSLRYKLLPDNIATGLLLLVPLAIFMITGLSLVIRGFIRRC